MSTLSNAADIKAATTSAAAQDIDAIELLTRDHANVKALFEQYDALSDRSRASKKKIATQICLELIKHATAEEEIFYPAVLAATKDEDMVDEATVEHASAKELIAQILAMNPDEDLYDAKVKVLSEQIEHHVGEEEGEMFPKARKAKLDLKALGAAIAARKEEIELPVMQ
ncbi:MAG: hemerythrin domain-containing protein [Pseudomonadota bacterium]|nr:hemerythrin domain-containing protein [Pseudomonadota bacterium]